MNRIPQCLLLLLAVYCVLSNATAYLEEDQASLNLGNKVEYLIEGNSPLTIQDVTSPKFSEKFLQAEGKSANLGIVEQVYWFRVSIGYKSADEKPSLKYLELDHPYLDHIEYYALDINGQFRQVITGDHYPFSQRPIKSHVFVFKTYLNPSHINHHYFRVKTSTSLQMPLTIWQPESFIKNSNNARLGYGFFYGALVIMFFYNLFVYFSVRDKSYLYYISYILAMGLGQMAIDGIGFELLWPNSSFLANYSTPIFLNFIVIGAIMFAREYLSIKQLFPIWEKATQVILIIVAISFVPLFFGRLGTAVSASTLLLICMSFFLLILGMWGIYKKQRRAYFFFAAWLALCLGTSARAALVLDIAPLNFLTLHGGQIGVLIELVLLSLALADRMNEDRAEKLNAVNLALISSEQALKANNERREVEEKLIQQSLYDQLTGHPNRVLCKEQLQEYIESKGSQNISVLCIHLNNFHDINNTLGHDTGDQLLVEFLTRLEDHVCDWHQIVEISQGKNPAKNVAIVEGVYLSMISSESPAQDKAQYLENLLEFIETPLHFNGMAITIGGQIGVANWPEHGNDAETLLRKAMIAVRAAKWSKRNYQEYDESIDSYSEKRLSLVSELKKAISDDELELYFQPKVSMKSGCVVSLEALIRWNHPEHGVLSPDSFIPIAESTGIIGPLTQWVLEDAISFCTLLNKEGFPISIAINISTRNLLEDDFVNNIINQLENFRLPSSKLVLEVVESLMIEDMELAIDTLNQLADRGIHLSIDDFGTGYSSLEYLKKLPVHELKIDRSFITDLVDSEEDKLIVNTTLAIAHQRGMDVVAEGIENKATFDLLKNMGCDIAQGYYISKPIPKAELINFLRNDSIEKNE